MDNSWIKLHRKFLESPLWVFAIKTNYNVLIKFWTGLLLMVNYEEKKWYNGTEEISIPAGSLVTSISSLSEQMALTSQTVRTCLRHCENMKMITSRSTNKYTQIWVVNWGKYQGGNDSINKHPNKRLTNEQQTTNKRLTTTKEYKKERIKEEDGVLSLTTRQLDGLKKEYPNTDIKLSYRKFREWQRSEGKVFKNVYARFRMWLIDDEIKGKREKIVHIETPPVKKKIYTFDEKDQVYYVTEE